MKTRIQPCWPACSAGLSAGAHAAYFERVDYLASGGYSAATNEDIVSHADGFIRGIRRCGIVWRQSVQRFFLTAAPWSIATPRMRSLVFGGQHGPDNEP